MLRPVFLIILAETVHGLTKFNSQVNIDENANPTVVTPLGTIQGSLLTSRLGKNFFAFRGIRYAKAPTDDLRFQSPIPVEKWEGIYNATQDGSSCPQRIRKPPPFGPMSEDCLFLNVYTQPPKKKIEKRSALIYFHAGGFYGVTGRSEWSGPQYLMDQDIILVTANYRLGSLGFLSTGDKEAPGNNGFKDQVLVMRWVKDNIASFGGDDDAVTISGYSAGAASVTCHLVSPLAQGLFHRAIVMSGSAYGNVPVTGNQLDLAKKQARLLQCPDDTSVNIVKCLKTKSAEELGNSLSGFYEFGYNPLLIWNVVIEPDLGQPRFMPAHPIELVLRGEFAKVPVMTGITTDEFAGQAFEVIGNATLLEDLNKNFEKIAPIVFMYERDTDNSKRISRELRKFYFKDKPIDNSSLPQLAQIFADAVIGFKVNRAAKLLAEKSTEPVYYYRFNYKGRYSHFYLPDSNKTIPYGVVHHDDLFYLFYVSKLVPKFTENYPESVVVDKLTTLWANFVKTGNPTPEPVDKLDKVIWKPFTSTTQNYLDIGNKLVLSEKLYEERYNEWKKLFPLSQYYKNENATKI